MTNQSLPNASDFQAAPAAGRVAKPSRRKWKRRFFRLGALLLGVIPFVVLEIVLAVFDIASPQSVEDPFVGFNDMQRLFERVPESGLYETARSRQLFFARDEFAIEKSPGTFRAFCLGGSTVQGRPYEPDTSFGRWLELELQACDRSQAPHRVVNCGGLSYASYRLRPILQEVLEYSPDLIVIATGHNEFLEDRTYHSLKSRSAMSAWLQDRAYASRTVTLARSLFRNKSDRDLDGFGRPILAGDVEARLDQRSGYASYHWDEQWRRQVIEHFEHSVRTMIEMCRRADVPLILVNLGANLRDCPPFKSEHPPGLNPRDERTWQVAFESATKLEEDDLSSALEQYQIAEAIDDQYALLAYRMARCFDRLDQIADARRYYRKARNLDVCPLRILDEMEARLRRLADETETPLVNARRLLEEHSPDGIPGYDAYLDHVHPTVQGHQWIAQAIARQWMDRESARYPQRWTPAARREAYRQHWESLSPGYLANGGRRVGWLENWARRERLSAEAQPKNARGFEHAGHRFLELADESGARMAYSRALELSPHVGEHLLEHACSLLQQGRRESSLWLLNWIKEQPDNGVDAGVIEFARLVHALVRGDDESAIALFRTHERSLERVANGKTCWHLVVPDAVEQARRRMVGATKRTTGK